MTIGELAFTLWPFHAQKADHFPLRDVKTQAQLVIEFHGPSVSR